MLLLRWIEWRKTTRCMWCRTRMHRTDAVPVPASYRFACSEEHADLYNEIHIW